MKLIGYAKAYMPNATGKESKYVAVGAVFTDDEGRIVIKIDALPRDMSAWGGWINVFPPEGKSRKEAAASQNPDDIPF